MKKVLCLIISAVIMCSCIFAGNSFVATAESVADPVVNEFLSSAYDAVSYEQYDGTNEYNYFYMGGRKYTQGFTLRGVDYRATQVSFNVANINSIEMTIGHLDNQTNGWGDDKTMKVYRDGELWQEINLTVHGAMVTRTFNVSSVNSIKFFIDSQSRYGFGDIKIDENTSMAPEIPTYDSVNSFMESGYNRINYNVYDGTNEYEYFYMSGRKYTQGFTLLGVDYQATQVSFNVENVNSIEMTIGHLDDQTNGWGDDKTMKVYRDGEWWQDIDLSVHGAMLTRTFNVAEAKNIRFYIDSQCRYGFAEIKVDGSTSLEPEVPAYDSVNSFMKSGYNRINYNIYDGTNEYNYFCMSGRKYTQGFTLLGVDYQATQVSFNVENVNSIEMTIGHLDDQTNGWGDDKTMKVYRDGEWWQDIDLTVHGALLTKVFDVSDVKNIRFYIDSQCRYGFADIKVDGNTTIEPEVPSYDSVNSFIENGYNRISYTTYDGTNEYNYFSMNGVNYTQGFTLRGVDYQATQVSFNTENLNKLSFGVGHIDNDGGTDQELIIYEDGVEYYRLPLKVDVPVQYYSLDLSEVSNLRFYINSQSRYGFVNLLFDDDVDSSSEEFNIVSVDVLKNGNEEPTAPTETVPTESTASTEPTGNTEPTGATEPTTQEPTDAVEDNIQVFSTKDSIRAGGTAKVIVIGNKSNEIYFKSLNEKVAKVSGKGVVTGLKKGTAKIMAIADGKAITVKVQVTSSPKLSKKTATVKVKKSDTVKISGKASGTKVKVSNCKVAKITVKNNKLVIKGKKKGTAKVTVTVNGVKLNLTVKVKK